MGSICSCLFFLCFLKNHFKSPSVIELREISPATVTQHNALPARKEPDLVNSISHCTWRSQSKWWRDTVLEWRVRESMQRNFQTASALLEVRPKFKTPTLAPISTVSLKQAPYPFWAQFYNPHCNLPHKMIYVKNPEQCWPPASMW